MALPRSNTPASSADLRLAGIHGGLQTIRSAPRREQVALQHRRPVGVPETRELVAGADLDQERSQQPRRAGPVLPDAAELSRRRQVPTPGCGPQAAVHGVQELACVVEVAAPEQPGDRGGRSECRVRGEIVTGDLDALGRPMSVGGEPAGMSGGAVFAPGQQRVVLGVFVHSPAGCAVKG
ncbi:hypothetical protein [Pseudonocardia sp. GCM10023141]|uniref:hypothetical protein n=1 Tax=Pseudonocardia sp. GCM10023141 TaxID=3252653 RepID=UPI00361BD82C